MATTATPPPARAAADRPDKGLKSNAIGYASNVVIAVASVAPGYSLAATLGFVVAVAGLQSPAVFLVAFIPMLLIAMAYRYLNRADPDAGTTFSWVTRAFGPTMGWVGGWVIIVADVVVMSNLAAIAGQYTFLLFGMDAAANNTLDVTLLGVAWIIIMTVVCYIGIELNARTQKVLLSAEVAILTLFAIVALVKVYGGSAPANSVHPHISWLNPFAASSSSGFFDGVLLAVFIYWGWDSGVAVNEESEDKHNGPGKAAVVSTFLLLAIYVVVSIAAQAFAGEKALVNHSDDVLSFLGTAVFGHGILNKLLILAILSSAAASTQTTILPTARTSLSMARHGALPKIIGRVHPRFRTPDVSTLWMGIASIAFYVLMTLVSQNVLNDSLVALGFQIAFYYGLTGFACAWYYRKILTRDAKTFWLVGVAPLVGGILLLALFIKAFHDYGFVSDNYYTSFLGVGTPVWIGVGLIVLGWPLAWLTKGSMRTPFWKRRTEIGTARMLDDPEAHAADSVVVPEGPRL